MRKRLGLWVTLACLVCSAAVLGAAYLIQASSRLQMGDPMWDSMLESSGATYSLPTNEYTSLSEKQAIELASQYAPDLADKATQIRARFLIHSSPQEGCEGRPVWVVTFHGVFRSFSSGPVGAGVAPEEPGGVEFTNVMLDALTGDVIFLESYGHR